MLSDDASCEGRKKVVKILRIITYDILPPTRPPHSKRQPCVGRWQNDWRAVETAAQTMKKIDDSEFEMAAAKIKANTQQ